MYIISLRRNSVLIFLLSIILILIAVIFYQNKTIDKLQNKQISEFFMESKVERDNTTAQALQSLKYLIDDEKTSVEDRRELTKVYMNLTLASSNESQIELILKSKGYEENLVYISDRSVTVIIRSNKKLSKGQIKEIEDVVKRVVEVDNIIIETKA